MCIMCIYRIYIYMCMYIKHCTHMNFPSEAIWRVTWRGTSSVVQPWRPGLVSPQLSWRGPWEGCFWGFSAIPSAERWRW